MVAISVFDVIGPNMVGPSSSHTAGAVSIALLAKKVMAEEVVQADFTLYGSFAKTYQGHGTDRALVGGILGFQTDDARIPDSFLIAKEKGLFFSFIPNETEIDVHPNTVDIAMRGKNGKKMTVRGESLGGGKVRLSRINNVEVDITGEYSTIVVTHRDSKGVLAHITRSLSEENVNIAFLKLFREAKGSTACCVVECDGKLPKGVADKIKTNPSVTDISLVDL